MNSKTIFIQIASYRDPELLNTLDDCLKKAKYPENLRFGISWQHSLDDKWDTLDEYEFDPRFKILDIDHKDSKGVCWARRKVQTLYDGEDYTLQLDSHHRFIENWDVELIEMLEDLRLKGHNKPLLTAYIPSFDPENDPDGRVDEPWWMTFDRFIPEGAIFFLPAVIPDWKKLDSPIPARFYSAHFAFTIGEFCKEVPHDPEMYFHGEEISIAVRAFTHGYDLFHPHKVIAWHEYTRKGRTKQWDDDPEWIARNDASHRRNRILFGMEEGCTPCMRKGLEPYTFGNQRTLDDYERYAGIRFKDRAVQQYTLDSNFAPNPFIENEEEYNNSFLRIFKHCIDIHRGHFKLDDYEFCVVALHDEEGNTLHREDLDETSFKNKLNSDKEFINLWVSFRTKEKVDHWVVWPYSKSEGWCERLTGKL